MKFIIIRWVNDKIIVIKDKWVEMNSQYKFDRHFLNLLVHFNLIFIFSNF